MKSPLKIKTIQFGSLMLFALASGFLMVGGSALAQQQATEKEVRAVAKADSHDVDLPHCLKVLPLSQEQQDQIKTVIAEHEAEIKVVWKLFGERYIDTIRTEVLLLSAIEDNLTEAQRNQVRAQRRKTAQHQKMVTGTDARLNQATSQPASAVQEEIGIIGITLTPEQELAADRLQEKYLSQLRSLNRDVQGLHIQLVSLEADKYVEIEKILTEDQLTELRKIRQTPPAKHSAAVERKPTATSR
jgi:hypothetical protein